MNDTYKLLPLLPSRCVLHSPFGFAEREKPPTLPPCDGGRKAGVHSAPERVPVCSERDKPELVRVCSSRSSRASCYNAAYTFPPCDGGKQRRQGNPRNVLVSRTAHGESSAVLGSPQVEQLANPKGAEVVPPPCPPPCDGELRTVCFPCSPQSSSPITSR